MLVTAAVAAAVAAAGTGAAFATGVLTASQTPQERQAALLEDLAGRLDVSVDKLKAALEGVAGDQIDQLLADGKITRAEADALKQRLDSGDAPLGLGLGFGPGFGHHGMLGGPGMGLDAAATYLGTTEAALRTQLESGTTLAEVAKAKGKTVDGLVQAMLDAARANLEQKSTGLTDTQKTSILAGLEQRIEDMVNGTMPGPGARFGFGARGMHDAGMQQMHRGGWHG